MSIEFKLSQDTRLLEQYYQLREQCFREELGLPEFDGSEDHGDRRGQILLAIQDGECIGGIRISPEVPEQAQLQELDIAETYCCTWERFVLAPAARTVQLFADFCAHLVEFSRALGYETALVLSSLRNARFYRKCHSALDVEFKIHSHVPQCAQGTFSDLEHYLSVAKLQDGHAMSIAA